MMPNRCSQDRGGRATIYGAGVDSRRHRLEVILPLLLEIVIRIRGVRLCNELDGWLRGVITTHCLIAVVKPAGMYHGVISAVGRQRSRKAPHTIYIRCA